jgi:hypothetical protein
VGGHPALRRKHLVSTIVLEIRSRFRKVIAALAVLAAGAIG